MNEALACNYCLQNVHKVLKLCAGDVAQLVERLSKMQEGLGSDPRPAHTCDPSTWESEVGASEVRGHLWLPTKLEANLSYMTVLISLITL